MKKLAILLTVLLLALLAAACAETESAIPTGEPAEYSVCVLDPMGKPCAGVGVQFMAGEHKMEELSTDKTGRAMASLPDYAYQVELVFSENTYYYNKQAAVFGQERQLTVTLAHALQEPTLAVYADGQEHMVHFVAEGNTYVPLQPGKRNYILFAPEQAGLYSITAGDAAVGYYGTSAFVRQENLGAMEDGVLQCNITENMLGTDCVLGIDAGEREGCIVQILRTGDAEIDWENLPWTEYTTTHTPQAFTLDLKAGQKLVYVDIFADVTDYNPVLAEDGVYRLNSIDGPMLYVNLGENAPYVSLRHLVVGDGNTGGTAFCRYFFDENGEFVKKEDYTAIISSYFPCLDPNHNIYPLTEDLAYILQNGGAGWWDATSQDYILTGCTPEIGWLFACCYVQ